MNEALVQSFGRKLLARLKGSSMLSDRGLQDARNPPRRS